MKKKMRKNKITYGNRVLVTNHDGSVSSVEISSYSRDGSIKSIYTDEYVSNAKKSGYIPLSSKGGIPSAPLKKKKKVKTKSTYRGVKNWI